MAGDVRQRAEEQRLKIGSGSDGRRQWERWPAMAREGGVGAASENSIVPSTSGMLEMNFGENVSKHS